MKEKDFHHRITTQYTWADRGKNADKDDIRILWGNSTNIKRKKSKCRNTHKRAEQRCAQHRTVCTVKERRER